jgi:hypothetical protein
VKAVFVVHSVHGLDMDTRIVTCSCGRAIPLVDYEAHVAATVELRSGA